MPLESDMPGTNDDSKLKARAPTKAIPGTNNDSKLKARAPTKAMPVTNNESKLKARAPTKAMPGTNDDSKLKARAPTKAMPGRNDDSKLKACVPTKAMPGTNDDSKLKAHAPTKAIQSTEFENHAESKEKDKYPTAVEEYLESDHPFVVNIVFPNEAMRRSIKEQKRKNVLNSSESTSGEFSRDYLSYLKDCESEEFTVSQRDIEAYSLTQNINLDELFLNQLQMRKKSKKFKDMQKMRRRLPIYAKREDIMALIENNQIVILKGDTGCGKTTQVPQFILDSYIESKTGSLCKIVCTQLRRISTVAVAERVADERCIYGNDRDVGYHIRLEKELPRKFGSITFCTTGMMLVQLQFNPFLRGYSHIIVDDVSEYDMTSDLFLLLLRDILKENKNLKFILMGADLEIKKLSKYFGDAPWIEVRGNVHPVKEFFLEDMIEKTNTSGPEKTLPGEVHEISRPDHKYEKMKEDYLLEISSKYKTPTITALRSWNEDRLDFELILKTIGYINDNNKGGTILVFLPGWKEIETLWNKICRTFPGKFWVIPLHSRSSSEFQKKILQKAQKGRRKIILSTNIAETSITIDDCTVVIDSGKFNMKNFDPVHNLHILKPQWIAKSNVVQRKGRAGRTQEGEYYQMFTKLKKSLFEDYPIPEMQRSSLEECILRLKSLKHKDIDEYLSRAIHPPTPAAVQESLKILRDVDALNEENDLTPLGFLLAKLPADVHIGKLLLYGAIFSCLDTVLSIAASLSFRDPFRTIIDKTELGWFNSRMLELSQDTQSDLILIAAALKAFEHISRHSDLIAIEECAAENFISLSALRMMVDLKYQFASCLKKLGFINTTYPGEPAYNRNKDNIPLIKALIYAAFYPNVAKSCDDPSRPIRAITRKKENVTVFPKSVNAFIKCIKTGWLVYHTKMKSRKLYIHNTTAVHPSVFPLFGGTLEEKYEDKKLFLLVDDWVKIQGSVDEIESIGDLRELLNDVLRKKIQLPSVTSWKLSEMSEETKVLQQVVTFFSCQNNYDESI